jgi:hypothetical protein
MGYLPRLKCGEADCLKNVAKKKRKRRGARLTTSLLLGHRARTDAGGADDHFDGFSVLSDIDFLQIGQPAPVSQIVGVADAVPSSGAFAADFATT